MTLRIESEAQRELAQSTLWYLTEAESPQAAERFVDEVEKAYKEIVKAPERYPANMKGLRF